MKARSTHKFLGVGAGRFHSVVWAKDGVYTFGLNAGQLGMYCLIDFLQHRSTFRIIKKDTNLFDINQFINV